eukprot:gene9490-1696_t
METVKQYFMNLSTKQKMALVAVFGFGISGYYIHKNAKLKDEAEKNPEKFEKKKLEKEKKQKFYGQLKSILGVLFPSIYCKETALLVGHTLALVAKTFLSLYIANLDGSIVKALVDREGKEFMKRLAHMLAMAVPATYLTSVIQFLEKKLSIALRTKLSKYSYELYMTNQTYYGVSNLDSRLLNADQCLTEDVKNFCETLAHVHSQISKPVLDIILNIWELSRLGRNDGNGSGIPSFIGAAIVINLTSRLLKWVRPRFSVLVKEQAELEGKLRFSHSRLIANSEQVAFYKGEKIEHGILIQSYLSLAKHMNKLFKARIFYTVMEQFLMKYFWNACGLALLAIPSFYYQKDVQATSNIVSDRTQSYITAKNLMIFGANAVERILLANKEISELKGYTDRVGTMLEVFTDISKGDYKKNQIKTQQTKKKGELVVNADYIKFEDVSIVTPNGEILVESVNFEIRKGQHLLISGPNGCGKSSLFRILGELWPVYQGKVIKPNLSNMFYIPQRPYLVIGTLRDQIIYPDTYEDMKKKNKSDADIVQICKDADLDGILEKENLDAVRDWTDVLSGGEKQRIGLARLFYHRPYFAILDECTSMLSLDCESKMYQHIIDMGITVLTVTHRSSLWKYHNCLLQYNGEGGINFSELNAESRLSLKEEKEKIENKLNSVSKMEKRLVHVCELLGEDSSLLNK